jgi:autotransporter-associated beta strand protein
MNVFAPKTQNISNKFDYVVVNSSLVDGSAPSAFKISKFAEGTNMNANGRVRIGGNSTYTGGTSILGGRQLVQIASSSVKSGSVITSGPFGTGLITIMQDAVLSGTGTAITNGTNDQNVGWGAYGADRTIDNDIRLDMNVAHTVNPTPVDVAVTPLWYFQSTSDDQISGATAHRTLTLNGTITLNGGASIVQNNIAVPISSAGTGTSYRDGSGDVIFNGNVVLAGTFTGATTPATSYSVTFGQTASSSATVVGKQVFNGNIQQTGTIPYAVTVTNGTAALPGVVQFMGQNTWSGDTTLVAAAPSSPASSSNIGLGSDTVLSGSTIISGPIGTGTLSLGNATAGTGTASSIEALGGARTLANPIALPVNQSNLVVRGTNNLTLTGVISGPGSLTKNNAGTLTLTAANTYLGNTAPTTVNGGTLLVNGSLAAATGATVASGATLGGTGSIAGTVSGTGTIAPGAGGIESLDVGSLSVAGTVLNFELKAPGSPGVNNDLLNVLNTDGLTITNGTVDLINAGGLAAGTYTLIDYVGTPLGNATVDLLTLGAQPAGFTYDLVDNAGNTSVDLLVTAVGSGASLASASVPEPGTLVLTVVAIGWPLVYRRRKS